MENDSPKVLISIVTWNNQETIEACVESILKQNELTIAKDYHLVIRDNNSSDKTKEILSKYSKKVEVHFEKTNLGFSVAHNLNAAIFLEKDFDYFFVLNPDAALLSSSLYSLISAVRENQEAGAYTPLLIRGDENLKALQPEIIDSAGIHFTPALRHFDTFAGEEVSKVELRKSFVFGGTGAALFLTKKCIKDINIRAANPSSPLPEIFDESFFAYREDAELAWRMQKLGWKTLFLPEVKVIHQRRVTPERRSSLPDKINSLGVQNRFLMQFIHFDFLGNWNCIIQTTFRNILVIAACLLKERSSLTGLKNAFSMLKFSLNKRKFIKEKSRVDSAHLAKMFCREPYREPSLTKEAAKNKKKESVHCIIINYFGEDHLSSCLNALSEEQESPPYKLSIEVVDNSQSTDLELINKFKNSRSISILKPESNLGFSGAINCSAKKYKEADYFLILNPDIQISIKSISKLVSALRGYKNLAAIQPILIGEDKKPQNGFFARGQRTLLSSIFELLFLNKVWPANPVAKALHIKNHKIFDKYVDGENLPAPFYSSKSPFPVDQPAAACLLIKKDAFFRVNGFDESFHPAWFEDVDFCLRLKEKNYLLACLSDAKAIHEGGYSKEKISPSDFYFYWHSNMQRFAKKHYKNFIIFKIFFTIGLIVRFPKVLIQTFMRGNIKETKILFFKTAKLIFSSN